MFYNNNRGIGEGVRDTNTTATSTAKLGKPPARSANVQSVMLSKKRERAWKQRLTVPVLILSDLLLTPLLWGLALVLYSTWGQEPPLAGPTATYMLASTVVWIGLRALVGLYPGYGLAPAEELRRQSYATLATLAVTTLLAFAFQVGDLLSRLLIGIVFVECLLAAPLVRHYVKWGLGKVGLWGKPALIVGAGETGRSLVRTLKEERGLGLRPAGLLEFGLAARIGASEGAPDGGSVANALHQARKQGMDTVIFAVPQPPPEYWGRLLDVARRRFPQVIVMPEVAGVTSAAVRARNLGGCLGLEIKENLLNPWALRAKRVLDLAATMVGGILVLPVLLVICLLIKMDSSGPVIYKDKRIGKDGKLFSCLKFRTMVTDAEDKLQRMLEDNAGLREEYLKYHKLRDDPRVTRVGRFLRKTSLDELPQLWNVLRGEMSLVGPRPYLPRESEEIGSAQEEILRTPPGITGPWQVAGRNHTSFEERVQMDAYYVRDWSVWLDLIILARTVESVVFGRGAS